MTVLVDLPREAPVVQPGVTLRSLSEQVSNRVLRPGAPRWWWVGFALGMALLLTFVVQLAFLFINGVGIWGVNIPVAWGFAIAEYVWWIALASGGTIVSALFFLTRSPWRSATNRIAETMLLSAAPCAGILPIMHLGRPGSVLLAVPVFECDGGMAAGEKPAVVGFHLPALLHIDVDHVLLYGALAGPRDGTRSGQDALEADLLWDPRARVARLGAALAQSADRLRDHVGDHGADGDLGAQRRRPRFRRRAHRRLALDPVPALFFLWRGCFRDSADHDADHPRPLGLPARGRADRISPECARQGRARRQRDARLRLFVGSLGPDLRQRRGRAHASSSTAFSVSTRRPIGGRSRSTSSSRSCFGYRSCGAARSRCS